MKKIIYLLAIVSAFLTSCENGNWDFPDFEYQAVYFAHQYPVRTIVQGEDLFDTSLDNEGKFRILATTAGVYENENNVVIDYEVNNGLTNGLSFTGSGDLITPMPDNYYELSSNQLVISEGEIVGGVEVQLTDAFFNDPLSYQTNYVIPLLMTSVQGADSILSGSPIIENPNRAVNADWAVRPKDFVFYAVKYINPWHGYYLRRGVEEVSSGTIPALNSTIVRHEQFVEDDEVTMLMTGGQDVIEYPVVYKDENENDVNVTIVLTFDNNGECTVSTSTANFTATGSGSFVKDGEEKSWGNQDRDALYLDYQVSGPDFAVDAVDTLVMRNRGVTPEFFSPVVE